MSQPHIEFFLRNRTPNFINTLACSLQSLPIWPKALLKCKKVEPMPVAVVLCGCGALDGTEISEAISTSIHIYRRNMRPLFYAPDTMFSVVNHLTREMDSAHPCRDVLVEAARLARSSIKPLAECDVCAHGALIIPGGFGAARTLSNFVEEGADCTVTPELEKLIEDFYCEKKPIGSMCIASALIAKVLKGVKVTLGKETPKEDWPYAEAIKKVKNMGGKVEMKSVTGVTRCKKYNVVSTPAWLYERATHFDVHEGIGKLVTMIKKDAYI